MFCVMDYVYRIHYTETFNRKKNECTFKIIGKLLIPYEWVISVRRARNLVLG